MAIKKLQNNFTTPEQSKRLLEFGVQLDSADMIIESGCDVRRTIPDWTVFSKWCCNSDGIINYDDVMPCWSVGRLIELQEILFPQYKNFIIERDDVTLISRMVRYYEIGAEQGVLDFSKLEE